MSDLISRAEAKEALRELFKRIPTYAIWAMHIIDGLPTHTTPSNTLGALDCVERNEAIKNLEQYKDLFSWDDGDRERAILSRVIKELQSMPSAQPEVIRCKDCKWRINQDESTEWLPCMEIVTPSDFYCGNAKLREEAHGK